MGKNAQIPGRVSDLRGLKRLEVALLLVLTFLLLIGPDSPAQPAAVIVKNSLSFSGNSIIVDSFNSADTNLSTDGLYDPSEARNNGDIVCDGAAANSIS